ncbi:accelerated cell death 11 [Apium graveolens]|uniref:accelerated cell death 11 n=1 Tax=Apium graveolens TaxID=4045 RepID=UPI003D7BAE62
MASLNLSTGADHDNNKPLRRIAEAFKSLSNSIKKDDNTNTTNSISQTLEIENSVLELAPFSNACSLVSPLFRCLGIAFRFAEMDYVAKVDDLVEASKSISTLQAMMDDDIRSDFVRKGGSHTRNLLRVKRGLDMVRVLFEQIIVTEGNSLKSPASTAYAQVFAPHHNWAIRKAVAAGMYALPTKAQLLTKLNEDEASARTQMQIYIGASAAVILYIDKLFHSKDLGIDW